MGDWGRIFVGDLISMGLCKRVDSERSVSEVARVFEEVRLVDRGLKESGEVGKSRRCVGCVLSATIVALEVADESIRDVVSILGGVPFLRCVRLRVEEVVLADFL